MRLPDALPKSVLIQNTSVLDVESGAVIAGRDVLTRVGAALTAPPASTSIAVACAAATTCAASCPSEAGAVPEPSTAPGLLAGACLLFALRDRAAGRR